MKTARLVEGRPVLVDEPPGFLEGLRIGSAELAGLNAAAWGSAMVEHSGHVGLVITRFLASLVDERAQCSRKRWGDRFHGDELAQRWSQVASNDDTRNLHELAEIEPDRWPRPVGVALRGGQVRAAEWPSPELHGFLRALVAAVCKGGQANEWADEYGRAEVVVTDQSVWFESCRLRPLKLWTDRGAVLLDATGALAFAETKAAHPKTEIEVFGVDVEPAQGSVRMLVRSWSGSRRNTLRDGEPTREAMARVGREVRAARQEARVRLQVLRPKVCVLTHKPLAEGLREGTLDDEDQPDEIGWYGRHDRGTNQFEGVDVLLTFGDPLGNLGAIQAQARALGIDANDLAASRAAATISQAHGRARWLRHRALLVHVGHVLPPDWGGRFEYTERVRVGGRPTETLREVLLEEARRMLADRGWIAPWAIEVMGQNSLKGLPTRDSVRSPEAFRRAAQRGVAQAATEAGATPVDVALPGRAGDAVWAVAGAETRAADEAAALWYRRHQCE